MAAASAANAADINNVVLPVPPAVVFQPVTHVHVEGGPISSAARITTNPADKYGDIPNDRGFYVGAAIRRLFRPTWSWQIAGTATWLRELVLQDNFGSELRSSLRFQTYDVDLGFNPGGNIHNRLFAGLRVLHSVDSLTMVGGGDFSEATGTAWMFGPRVGASAQLPLGAGGFALVADISASALFGNATVFFDATDMSGWRTAFNLEGQVGFGWNPPGQMEFVVGYRAQQWWGIRHGTSVSTFFADATVDTDKFLHGPFARLGFDF